MQPRLARPIHDTFHNQLQGSAGAMHEWTSASSIAIAGASHLLHQATATGELGLAVATTGDEAAARRFSSGASVSSEPPVAPTPGALPGPLVPEPRGYPDRGHRSGFRSESAAPGHERRYDAPTAETILQAFEQAVRVGGQASTPTAAGALAPGEAPAAALARLLHARLPRSSWQSSEALQAAADAAANRFR